MSAHYLNFPFKILKNSPTATDYISILLSLKTAERKGKGHKAQHTIRNEMVRELSSERMKMKNLFCSFQVCLTTVVTFQIIRFLLGSHEGFLILQNNKTNIVAIPYQMKSCSPQHKATSE